jgi:hypothetical protein
LELTLLSGKQVSCGTIALYCLNLPPEVRYLPENLFIVGLTPSPSKPTATTLLHLLDPLMKTVLQYNFPGKAVTTYSHPEGMNVTARIIPLVADHPASRETGGFLQHSANMFCSLCLLTKDEKDQSDYWAFPGCVASVVLKQARQWLNQPTKDKQIAWRKKLVFAGPLCTCSQVVILLTTQSWVSCTTGLKVFLNTNSEYFGV